MSEPALPSNIGLYRSGVTSPERLRRTSVARRHLLDNAIESLRGSVGGKSKSHQLFIGPGGTGKTHLLSCIEEAVQSDAALGASVVVIRFPEESNRTLSFADFLIGMCGILKEILEDEPLWDELFAAVQTEEDDARVAGILVPAFRDENRRRGRTLLVMLENLGEVLGRQIRNRSDVAALRAFLTADNGCLLIATAPLHFDGITDVEQPFFDVFEIRILEAMSLEETVDVIRLNLECDGRAADPESLQDMRPRLQALYRMTQGNPRLTMMLYELSAHESVTGVQDQFHLMADRISPFYRGRLRDLPPGQRALLECLASMRDLEKTPAAIALRMRTSQQETSSLLKRLSDARYIRAVKHPRDGRSRLYTIREGFFDIWLAMNLSGSARRRISSLLEFFSFFYPDIETREEKRRQLRAKPGDANAQEAPGHASEAGDEGQRAAATLDTARILARRPASPLAGDGASRSIVRIVAGTPPATDYLSEIEGMIAAWEMHRSGCFEFFAHRVVETGKGLTLRTFSETKLALLQDSLESVGRSEERIAQRLAIANVLMDLARWNETEEQRRHALAEATELARPKLVAMASNDLAQLLHLTNRPEEAEALARRALEITKAAFGKQHPIVAIRLNNLAVLLHDPRRSEPLMRQALAITEAAFGKWHPAAAACLNSLAILLHDTGRPEEAEPLMRRALEIDEAALGGQHPTVAIRLNNLAMLVNGTHLCEPLVRKALEIDEAALGGQHPAVAACLGNLATLLHDAGRSEDAEPLMRRALEIDETALGRQHPTVAISLNSLAALLHDTGRLPQAELLMRRSFHILDSFARRTGHEHPEFRRTKADYQVLRRILGPG